MALLLRTHLTYPRMIILYWFLRGIMGIARFPENSCADISQDVSYNWLKIHFEDPRMIILYWFLRRILQVADNRGSTKKMRFDSAGHRAHKRRHSEDKPKTNRRQSRDAARRLPLGGFGAFFSILEPYSETLLGMTPAKHPNSETGRRTGRGGAETEGLHVNGTRGKVARTRYQRRACAYTGSDT